MTVATTAEAESTQDTAPLMIVSCDTHIGPRLAEELRPYCPAELLDDFDGFQYAHAWSFVYFLNTAENGKYQKSFTKFFKGLGDAADGKRKFGVEENGLCLLAAYCFEGLQHART